MSHNKLFICGVCGIKERRMRFINGKNICTDCLREEIFSKSNIPSRIIGNLYDKSRIRIKKNERIGRYIVYRGLVERKLGRCLNPTEVIHHIDGNHENNSIENLLITNNKEHKKLHYQLEKLSRLLFENGFIIFNLEKKQYNLNPEFFLIHVNDNFNIHYSNNIDKKIFNSIKELKE